MLLIINGAATIITDGDDNDYVAQSYGKKTVINVNQKGGKRVEGLGHLYAGTGSKLNWNMDIAGSSLRGWLQSSSGGEVNLRGSNNVILEGGSQFLDNSGIINVDLQNNALWKMVASSELTALYLYSGAAVDMMADNNAYSTLTTEKLSGNGGLLNRILMYAVWKAIRFLLKVISTVIRYLISIKKIITFLLKTVLKVMG